MTVENEKSINVKNDELIKDIELTHRENDVYSKLMEGFLILSELPLDISSEKRFEYTSEFRKYSLISGQCSEFLKKLYELKAERGL